MKLNYCTPRGGVLPWIYICGRAIGWEREVDRDGFVRQKRKKKKSYRNYTEIHLLKKKKEIFFSGRIAEMHVNV